MRDSRLAVNNVNTQIMCLASARKTRALWDKGEKEKMGTKITEMEWGTVLGLTWNLDLQWKRNTEMMLGKFNRKQYRESRGINTIHKRERKI